MNNSNNLMNLAADVVRDGGENVVVCYHRLDDARKDRDLAELKSTALDIRLIFDDFVSLASGRVYICMSDLKPLRDKFFTDFICAENVSDDIYDELDTMCLDNKAYKE